MKIIPLTITLLALFYMPAMGLAQDNTTTTTQLPNGTFVDESETKTPDKSLYQEYTTKKSTDPWANLQKPATLYHPTHQPYGKYATPLGRSNYPY